MSTLSRYSVGSCSGDGRLNGGVPERSKGSDCKSAGSAFEGSNPSPSTTLLISYPAITSFCCAGIV